MYILEKVVLLFISETLPIVSSRFCDLRVCGRERLIPVCSVTETGLNIEIFHVAGWHNRGSRWGGGSGIHYSLKI